MNADDLRARQTTAREDHAAGRLGSPVAKLWCGACSGERRRSLGKVYRTLGGALILTDATYRPGGRPYTITAGGHVGRRTDVSGSELASGHLGVDHDVALAGLDGLPEEVEAHRRVVVVSASDGHCSALVIAIAAVEEPGDG